MSSVAYKVSQVPGAGVGLLASRDLLPGEFILAFSQYILKVISFHRRSFHYQILKSLNHNLLPRRADPLRHSGHLISPNPVSSAMLAVLKNSSQPRFCLRPLWIPTLWTWMPGGWPAQVEWIQSTKIFSEKFSFSFRIECEVFERADFEAEIDDLNVPDDHYAAILPLRSVTSYVFVFWTEEILNLFAGYWLSGSILKSGQPSHPFSATARGEGEMLHSGLFFRLSWVWA